jgi:dTDP-4-amino-4,6-dideoxygalactose transaminase
MTEPIVPFLDLIAPHRQLEDELVLQFREALRTGEFVGGRQVEAFEDEFAAYCGAGFSVGVASGTDALCLALSAVGLGRGDAAITVAHTFVATVEAIHHAGAEAEFVDIDDRTCTMSAEALEAYLAGCGTDRATGHPIGRRTGLPIKAVVPVHLYGQIADMDGIERVARRYQLAIVEDACQAHGAEYLRQGSGENGGTWMRAGSLGTAAAFSFYPSKNLGACGEGGAVTTSEPAVAARVRLLRDHGQRTKYRHECDGYNSRLDAIQAALLRVKLRHLDGWNASRRLAAGRYDAQLASVPGIATPLVADGRRHVYHLYVIRTPERDALAAALKAEGIQTGLHYPIPVHWQPGYRHARGDSLPVTERVASEVLSLPLFPTLGPGEQQHVMDAVQAFVGAGTIR